MPKNNVQAHIRCGIEDAAEYAILPGDPKRVDKIKEYLDNVREVAFNREFKSITGYYKGVKVMVVSTGIGGVSTGIAVEELKNIGVKTMIRIGSCGALQKDMKLGELIIANGAVRDEGTSSTYISSIYPAIPDTELLTTIIEATKELNIPSYVGRVRSHDSFYTDEEEDKDNFWCSKGILGCDMETAALFVIASLRGIKAASILNIVVEREGDLEEGINEYVTGESLTAQGEHREIITALEAIIKLNNKNKI